MPEYIDREAVIMDILCAGKIGKLSCIDIIKRAPAADVRPVVRGEWIKPTGMMPPEHHGHYECSICGWWAMRDWAKPWNGIVLTNFCPNCGADMNGKESRKQDG